MIKQQHKRHMLMYRFIIILLVLFDRPRTWHATDWQFGWRMVVELDQGPSTAPLAVSIPRRSWLVQVASVYCSQFLLHWVQKSNIAAKIFSFPNKFFGIRDSSKQAFKKHLGKRYGSCLLERSKREMVFLGKAFRETRWCNRRYKVVRLL